MDDQFKQTGYTRNRKLKHLTRSKSFDDLVLTKTYKNNRSDQSHHVSDTTRTILDLSLLGDEERYRNGESDDEKTDEHIHFDLHRARTRQRSRSAPISPTLVDDQEFAAFIQCEQQQQQTTTDSFVYNMDLSDSIESSHQPKSRTSIFDVRIADLLEILVFIRNSDLLKSLLRHFLSIPISYAFISASK